MNYLSFYDYMQDFLEDDTPLGDLARHIHAHAEFPEGLHTSDEILACFREAQRYDQLNYADLKRAIALYMQFGSLK
ncbi:YozE family protein [Staphylococcus agnetis]|uniref:YozE family protein n=2 Tax=Staphylococcus agnetis TaxID=985762 RepID=UPI0013003F98|nr:hypothetical protein [Staphylococcus agnetis]